MSSTTPATEPAEVSAEGSIGSGGSLLRAIRDGQLPPPRAAQLLGLDLVDVQYGHVVFNFDAATRFDNGQAAIHGGVLAAVLDLAVSTAMLTTVDIGTTVVTSNLNVTFVRPVHPDNGTLRCVGTLVHRGHRNRQPRTIVIAIFGRGSRIPVSAPDQGILCAWPSNRPIRSSRSPPPICGRASTGLFRCQTGGSPAAVSSPRSEVSDDCSWPESWTG